MLASVQKIKRIDVHPFADKLDIASVLGWKCCVRKGEFKENDLIVYFEPDALLPQISQFEFLRERGIATVEDEQGNRFEGYRIRTVKLRKVISTGLVLSVNEFPELSDSKEGDNVAEILGVKKWSKSVLPEMKGIPAGVFPAKIYKTDEIMVQSLQFILTKYRGTECYISEKIDGSSSTYSIIDGEFVVSSRNISLKEDGNDIYWKMAKKYSIEEKMRAYVDFNNINHLINFAIQGEIIGPGVNGNALQLNDYELRLFNAYDVDNNEYFNFYRFMGLAQYMGIATVPVLDQHFILIDDIDELVRMAEGKSIINPKVDREGIVIRPINEINDYLMPSNNSSPRVSFKVINPEYAAKEK